MGWIIEEEGLYEAHEGYAAYVAPDGRLTGASNGVGILIDRADADQAARRAWRAGRPPANSEMYDTVPWADLAGWQAACSCGWTGTRWDRAGAIVGHVGAVVDEENSWLPDGRSVYDATEAEWLEHVNPLRALGRVSEAAQALAAARRDLDLAVMDARTQEPPASWAEIGRAAGMTRQAARERWGSDADPRPAPTEFDGELGMATEERLRRRDSARPARLIDEVFPPVERRPRRQLGSDHIDIGGPR